jgi:diaminopimelate epimerase
MTLNFIKMNGAGNDFVMLDNRDLGLSLTKEQIEKLCDRHRGIGADGLLCVEPATEGGDFKMRYYNADGGEAEMCGNGARCFGRFVNHLHGDTLTKIRFETLAGMISAEFEAGQVRINMSAPHSLKLAQSLPVAGAQLTVHSVNTGVPHAVVLVDDLESVPVREWGAGLRYHEAFKPKGTNANFASSPSREIVVNRRNTLASESWISTCAWRASSSFAVPPAATNSMRFCSAKCCCASRASRRS